MDYAFFSADSVEPVIDFSWFYFIGKVKLHMSFKETGRMTLTMFNKLYKHYKDDWDMEMLMRRAGMTYKKALEESIKDEEWI